MREVGEDYNEEDYDELTDKSNKGDVIRLTDLQLNETLPLKMLLPNNPQAPINTSVYNYRERKFVTDELVDQLVIHFSYDG